MQIVSVLPVMRLKENESSLGDLGNLVGRGASDVDEAV